MGKANQNTALREAIRKSGLSYAEVAERAGYEQGYRAIWPYATGRRPLGDRVREKLELALGLPPGGLLGVEPSRPAKSVVEAYRSFLQTPQGRSARQIERDAAQSTSRAVRVPATDRRPSRPTLV